MITDGNMSSVYSACILRKAEFSLKYLHHMLQTFPGEKKVDVTIHIHKCIIKLLSVHKLPYRWYNS